jgi:hypothetical protein
LDDGTGEDVFYLNADFITGCWGAAAFGALDESIVYVCGVGLENMCVWLLDLARHFHCEVCCCCGSWQVYAFCGGLRVGCKEYNFQVNFLMYS